MAIRFQEVERMTVIPPPTEYVRTGVSLPKDLLERLEQVQEKVNAGRSKPDRLSRDRLVQLLLEWAIKEWEAQEAKKKR